VPSDEKRKGDAAMIIHKATTAAVSSSALLTFVGGTNVLRVIAVSMVRQIAKLFDKELEDNEASALIEKLGRPALGMAATMTFIGFLPILGNMSNAAISHGYIERLGWAVFDYFSNENSSPQQLGHRNIFICYSHKDKKYAERLLDHLRCFEIDGKIETFVDTVIKPGSLWKDKITEALDRAKLAIVLISPDFLLSQFIGAIELPAILEQAKKKYVVVFPVVTTPTPKTGTVDALLSFQSPINTIEPLSKMKNAAREQAYKQIAEATVDTLKTAR